MPRLADAEEVRAQLALQGLTARVAAVQVAGTTWHRVLIGPVSDTRTAEEVAARLRGMKYTPVVSRMAD